MLGHPHMHRETIHGHEPKFGVESHLSGPQCTIEAYNPCSKNHIGWIKRNLFHDTSSHRHSTTGLRKKEDRLAKQANNITKDGLCYKQMDNGKRSIPVTPSDRPWEVGGMVYTPGLVKVEECLVKVEESPTSCCWGSVVVDAGSGSGAYGVGSGVACQK
jgi:hypothetical protein